MYKEELIGKAGDLSQASVSESFQKISNCSVTKVASRSSPYISHSDSLVSMPYWKTSFLIHLLQ
jgi:enoyl-[acyl-carrier-protein] reductase (NADH)